MGQKFIINLLLILVGVLGVILARRALLASPESIVTDC